MVRTFIKIALALVLGAGAGAFSASLFFPITEDHAAYAAATCMGWKPVRKQKGTNVPLLATVGTPRSYRFVTVTSIGSCSGEWTRRLMPAPAFTPGTPVTVFEGPHGKFLILIRASEASGFRTYMGSIYFPNDEPRERQSVDCRIQGQREQICKM